MSLFYFLFFIFGRVCFWGGELSSRLQYIPTYKRERAGGGFECQTVFQLHATQ